MALTNQKLRAVLVENQKFKHLE